MNTSENDVVPRIREDLELIDGGRSRNGKRLWTLLDPLSGRYFELHQSDIEILVSLDLENYEEIAILASNKSGVDLKPADIKDFVDFLRRNNLVIADEEQKKQFRKIRKSSNSWIYDILKGYLYFRLHLVRPDKFLTHTLPYVAWLGSNWFLFLTVIITIWSISRIIVQQETFWSTFLHFFDARGAVIFVIALSIVKIFHELGHAFVAKAHGCKVPTMGVAFLVMWPVLFTDTTDIWRLKDRSSRIKIGVSGMAVEITIGAFALLFWSFLEDGPLRSVCFILGTTTWVASIIVNINPFMRFDGYYIFSDWIQLPNLEERSHAQTRWALRELLFGLGDSPPEPPRKIFIVFSLSVWIYRFLLFLGIAILVYYFFFKALGIILFLVEIIYFIFGPIWRELRRWYLMRQKFKMNKNFIVTAISVAGIVLLCLLPWQKTVRAPAVMKQNHQTIFATDGGKVSSIETADGRKVTRGLRLLSIEASDIDFNLKQARAKREELVWRRASLGFSTRALREAILVDSELATQNQIITSVLAKKNRLNVRSPFDGVTVNMIADLKEGDWVSDGEPLMIVREEKSQVVIGFFSEQDLVNLRVGQSAKFFIDGSIYPIHELTVRKIEDTAIKSLENLYAASLYGGGVAVREGDNGKLYPVKGTYRVEFNLPYYTKPKDRVLRGTIHVTARTESFAISAYRWVLTVLTRELSF